MNTAKILAASLIAGSMSLMACSSAEPVDVSGELTSTETIDSPILVDFFEVDAADAESERESVHQVTLDALGPIAETVEADPEATLIAHGLVDTDGDGACTEGEIWGETELTRDEEGAIAAFVLDLKAQPCPAVEAEAEE